MIVISFIKFFIIVSLSFLTVIAAYHLFWLVVSLFYREKTTKVGKDQLNRFAIIIPAHNEELVIGPLIESANRIEYPSRLFDVHVIVDNCTDKTAEIAGRLGTNCHVRNDPIKKGKPYALNWIFKKLDLSQYDAFVIVDADTTIDNDFLKVMNDSLNRGNSIIQGYFGILNSEETWLTRLMVIPGVLKYHYRYRGKKMLGFSCPLMGNGMCFSRKVIERYGWDAFSLTENWEYYIKSLLRGYITTYEDAYIFSQTAATTKQGVTQRKRWSKGKLHCAKSYAYQLLSASITRMDVVYIDAVIELTMPSISMYFNCTLLILIVSVVASLFSPEFYIASIWAAALILFIFSYFIFGIASNRSPALTWLALGKAPFFLAWKLLTTISAVLTLKNKDWVKTNRE